MKRDNWRLSASWINEFKACPMRCYYKYILGLRPIEKTDALRMGTNWHKLLEIMELKQGGLCPDCHPGDVTDNCPLCDGTGVFQNSPMDAAIRYIDLVYAEVPPNKAREEWLIEKTILIYSLSAYNWYYSEANELKTIDSEMPFEIPLYNPETGKALPNVKVVGKIDALVEDTGGHQFVKESKSTTKAIDPDSDFWKHLSLNVQCNMYPLATQILTGKTGGVIYDAWHKPGIKPKKLTQADSKEFVKTGKYCEQKFKRVAESVTLGPERKSCILIAGKEVQVEPGKKEGTFTIKETPEMFGARLLQDITERPEFYFARKEIAVIESDIERFKWELYNIYQTARNMDKNNCWYTNDQACEATFHCTYRKFCYNNIKFNRDSFKDENNIPDGFRVSKYITEKERV